MNERERLFEKRDPGYAAFQAKLTPGISPDRMIGVRVPDVRKLAKEIYKEGSYESFLRELPHTFYDENMLHGLIISEMKDFGACVRETELFLPFVDNWAVCDIMSPKVFGKNKAALMDYIVKWSVSPHVYTCRFGIEMLMSHYLDADFRPEYLEIAAGVRSEEYYVNMMIAWFFATALSKQWDAAFPYIEEKRLSAWVHNKTVQKARESFRITPEQKEILQALRITQ